MQKRIVIQISLALSFTLMAFFYFNAPSKNISQIKKLKPFSEEKESAEMESSRGEYFFMMLRDPKTNRIPFSIRHKELEFAKKLNESNKLLSKSSATNLTWKEAGPNDVGGRTRALAVDITDPNTIIAGGVSGGIWKSTDNGTSWALKSSPTTILSVTSIAQDPRSGFTNIWYYSTGEYRGSTGSDISYSAFFTGNGIYKSTDNGESWNVLPNTLSSNVAQWDSPFDYVSRIIVNPVNGNVFLASNGFGIYRSTNEGSSFSLVLGGNSQHIWSDVAVGF